MLLSFVESFPGLSSLSKGAVPVDVLITEDKLKFLITSTSCFASFFVISSLASTSLFCISVSLALKLFSIPVISIGISIFFISVSSTDW